MNHAAIGLIAAMPEEIKPLLAGVGPYRKERIASFNLFRFAIADQQACLIESGMGPVKATAATEVLIKISNPSVIVNFGFAGAVTEGPSVGDLVIAEHLLYLHDSLFLNQDGLALELVQQVHSALVKTLAAKSLDVYVGTFITAVQIIRKQGLIELLPPGCNHPVLEMETAAVAKVAENAGIPLLAIRAISDAADEELKFSLDEFTDREMNVRMTKVLETILRKPWIIPQLWRLSRNTKRAGIKLAQGVESIVRYLNRWK